MFEIILIIVIIISFFLSVLALANIITMRTIIVSLQHKIENLKNKMNDYLKG